MFCDGTENGGCSETVLTLHCSSNTSSSIVHPFLAGLKKYLHVEILIRVRVMFAIVTSTTPPKKVSLAGHDLE